MRILLLPNVGLRNLRGDSNTVLYGDLARTFAERSEGRLWMQMVLPWDSDPDAAGLTTGEVWVQSETIPDLVLTRAQRLDCTWRSTLPQTGIEYEDRVVDYMDGDKAIDGRIVSRYGRVKGERLIDAVITSRQRIAPSLLGMWDERRDGWGKVPIYLLEPFVRFYRDESEAIVALSYALTTPVFLTQHEQSLAADLCRHWLSGAAVDDMLQRSLVMPLALNTSVLDVVLAEHAERGPLGIMAMEPEAEWPTADDARDHLERAIGRAANGPQFFESAPFRLFYGARFSPYKRIDVISEVYDHLFSAGRNVTVTMTTPTDDFTSRKWFDAARYPYVDLRTRVTRDDFLRAAVGCQAFIVASTSEGLPIGFLEQLYLGLVGVVFERPWTRGALPDWYPYRWTKQTEAVAWFHILEDRWRSTGSAWAPGELDRLRTWMTERYSARNSYGLLWDRIQADKGRRPKMRTGDDLIERGLHYWNARVEALRAEEQDVRAVTLRRVLEEMERHSTAGFRADQSKTHRPRRFPSDYEVWVTATEDFGWRDRYAGPDPLMEPPSAVSSPAKEAEPA